MKDAANSEKDRQHHAAPFMGQVIGFKVRRLHGLIQSGWAEWFAGYDLRLTPMQGGMLILVSDNPGLTQTGLAGLLGIEPPTLSQSISPLLERGLIERRKVNGDKRAHALHLTKVGADAVALVRREIPRHEKAVLERLNPGEQRELHRLLDKALGDGDAA